MWETTRSFEPVLKNLFAVLILALTAIPPAAAADYLLRIESIEYIDATTPGTPRKTGECHAMDVVCRPGQPARCTSRLDNKTITLDAVIRLAKDGHVSVNLDYCYSVDKGETVPNGKGGVRKKPDVQQAITTVSGRLNQTIEFGGLAESRREGNITLCSTNVFRVTVQEYKPESKQPVGQAVRDARIVDPK
jgi:hypothetical protein